MDRKRRQIINIIATVVVIAVCMGVIAISFVIKSQVEGNVVDSVDTGSGDLAGDQKPEEPVVPDPDEIIEAKFINLQPIVDRWHNSLDKNTKVGVMIYDLNNSRTAASFDADVKFNVASIYKLLFAYDGYRQLAIGSEKPDQFLVHTEEKGDLTVSKCLDLIIRESYNGCADVMARDTNRISRVNGLMRDLDMSNTSNIGLESTAADLTKLLRAYWRHTDLTEQLWRQLSDSMLNQPATTYDWRQGLPAGFSDSVKVYNKVGWERNVEDNRWNIYADAAIVDFTEFKHYYTVVVLTQNLKDYKTISQLGRMIEDAVIMNSEGITR